MKKHLLLIVILITMISYAQLKPLKDADLLTKEVTKNTSFKVDKFEFKIEWIDKLSHSPNLGYLGGIESLKIYSKGRLINDFKYYYNQSLTSDQIADIARNDGNRSNISTATYSVTITDSDGGCPTVDSLTLTGACGEMSRKQRQKSSS